MFNALGSRRTANQSGENGAPDANGIPPAHSIGATLRERREAMGATLEEVEIATRIRQKYLAALEADDWHLLPGEIVGRGFLRNYTAYLELEPEEMLERRRAIVDPTVATALSSTSAGAPLPPERAVDYRPKEVDLKDELDEEEETGIRLGPILVATLLILLLFLGWRSAGRIWNGMRSLTSATQERIASALEPAPITPTLDLSMAVEAAATINPTPAPPDAQQAGDPSTLQNDSPSVAGSDTDPGSGFDATTDSSASDGDTGPVANAPRTVGDLLSQQEQVPPAADAPAAQAPVPTPTPIPPTPIPPTPVPPTPVPPTPTPEPPTPEPQPVVQAVSCPDARAAFTSPGANQTLSGAVDIVGTATHEAFQYYKLEYAPGANAGGGFVYFDGANGPVVNGRLGTLNTTSLPNGQYTLRILVVDQTGNYPPPCQVTVTIQN